MCTCTLEHQGILLDIIISEFDEKKVAAGRISFLSQYCEPNFKSFHKIPTNILCN